MLSENLHRNDLTVGQEADSYAQLALLDIDADAIAERLALPAPRVSAGLALTRLPRSVRAEAAELITAQSMDLEQVLALEEFRDDEHVLARLMDTTGSGAWQFRHILAEERSRRSKRQAVEALTAELVLQRVTVVAKPRDWYTGDSVPAEELLDRDGTPLDPNAAKARPGFRVWIDDSGEQPEAVIFCLDPDEWGYERRRTATEPSNDTDNDQNGEAGRQVRAGGLSAVSAPHQATAAEQQAEREFEEERAR